MKMMSSYSSIEGIGFAIPSATVIRIVNLLVKDGDVTGRPAIGITVGMIPDEAREQYPDKLPKEGGLYIVEVSDGSDAQKKDLRPGDVILEVDGVAISTTAELSTMKDKLNVGDTMHFKIFREGEILEIDVALVDTNDVYG
jgi:serine protease Do